MIWSMIKGFFTGTSLKLYGWLAAIGAGLVFVLRMSYLSRKNVAQKEEIKDLRTKEKILEAHDKIEESYAKRKDDLRRADSAESLNRLRDKK